MQGSVRALKAAPKLHNTRNKNSSAERWHTGTKEEYGGNPDRVTLGLGQDYGNG